MTGTDFVREVVALRTVGDYDGARRHWQAFNKGREDSIQARFDELVERAYADVCAALSGAEALVTHGNVDRPDVLRRHLPESAHYVDGEVVEVEGHKIGFAGGGMPALGIPGEVSEEAMARKLEEIGPVDILCSHVPPAVAPLSRDVIGGRQKGSVALRDYLETQRPAYHYFGDVHQPQATRWRYYDTECVNVGYFRATGRATRHR